MQNESADFNLGQLRKSPKFCGAFFVTPPPSPVRTIPDAPKPKPSPTERQLPLKNAKNLTPLFKAELEKMDSQERAPTREHRSASS